MEELLLWDYETFKTINTGIANGFLDWLMPLFRNQFIWVPVYVFFAAFFIYNFKPKGLYIVLFGILTIMITDQVSAHLIKPIVMRLRPCADVLLAENIRMLVPCGSGYSFPSTHATNHFAFSVFLISVLPNRMRWVLPFAILWAAGVGFAQIYVGLHFPMDVIAGALLGSSIGLFTASMCKSALRINLDRAPDEEEIISNEDEPLNP